MIVLFSLLLYPVILVLIIVGAVFLWFFRYRFVSFVRHEHTSDMDSQPLEGYTDKMFYFIGETIGFYLNFSASVNHLQIRRMSAPKTYEEVYAEDFSECTQELRESTSETGCDWIRTTEVTIDERFHPGYYQALLSAEASDLTFGIYFLVGEKKPSTIAILAPVSTWTAYNPWGGKSLYQNRYEAKTVHNVSTLRPNTAFALNHDIEVEANIFNWFAKNYPDVALLPDFALEKNSDLLSRSKIVVLAYHCEYVTKKMYDALKVLTDNGKSLISLGANQLYWKTCWHDDFTRLECRKDLTFFDGGAGYGGMWKHHFRSAKKYLGVQFSRSGMHTYAPYKVIKPDHWLFDGLQLQEEDLFGMRGLNAFPIAGIETDKASPRAKNVEVIAHSLNCDSERSGTIYESGNPAWNGDGGGDLAIKYSGATSAVLSTGAIYSGSGLGTDDVFTQVIKNFVRRFEQ